MLSLVHKMLFSQTREEVSNSSSSSSNIQNASVFTHLYTVLYPKILGHANAFKEIDASENLAAENENERIMCQQLIESTEIKEFLEHAIYPNQMLQPPSLTFGALKQLLLICNEDQQNKVLPTLSSDVIACTCKICSNEELCKISSRISTALPHSKVGTCGYMGARIQPNSPTDNPADIIWQVFDGFSYAVGDVLLGTNPVSSRKQDVRAIELALKGVINAFGLKKILPYCALSHIDIQAEIEEESPDTTTLWFQSIAGVDTANKTFDLSIEKLKKYASKRIGQYSFYFETGQGADVTNGHGHGFDTLIHESRKYGLARKLKELVAQAQKNAGHAPEPWIIVNDVAGFIGPEVFRTKEQLVRCCLEDTFMAKLHQLTCGLDICTTLHQDISLDDLDWCLDHIMPANPGYIMALPTKNDPMLSYLTTAFQDHVRIRNKFGYKVNDQMWEFFQKLEVIDQNGEPTKHFGQPKWVYVKYKQMQGDRRNQDELLKEAEEELQQVRARGVYIAEGYGANPWEMNQALSNYIKELYLDAKKCIWNEFPANFQDILPMKSLILSTKSQNRQDYILHPTTGEHLDEQSLNKLN